MCIKNGGENTEQLLHSSNKWMAAICCYLQNLDHIKATNNNLALLCNASNQLCGDCESYYKALANTDEHTYNSN